MLAAFPWSCGPSHGQWGALKWRLRKNGFGSARLTTAIARSAKSAVE
jgi:hypothetical protein